MEIVTEIKERLAQPGAKSATEELLGRAGGEIERLRGQYEKQGVIDPWTGAWVADGKVTVPDASLDAAGRAIPAGAVDAQGQPVVATHARDARGQVVKVEPASPVRSR